MKSCGVQLGNESTRYFVQELRKARLDALADAEGWRPLVLIFERLAKLLKNDPRTNLNQAKDCLIALASAGEIAGATCQPIATPTEVLVQLVIQGRNEEFHGGAAVRRFVHHCIELSIRLEDALKRENQCTLGIIMSPNPTCVQTWQSVYYARRLMLEYSFTWLPMQLDGKWVGISDYAVGAYMHQGKSVLGETLGAATQENASPRLATVGLRSEFGPETEILEVISELATKPVLVTATDKEHLIGIVTPFDLL